MINIHESPQAECFTNNVTHLAASKDGPFCNLVLGRLKDEDLLTDGAERKQEGEDFSLRLWSNSAHVRL